MELQREPGRFEIFGDVDGRCESGGIEQVAREDDPAIFPGAASRRPSPGREIIQPLANGRFAVTRGTVEDLIRNPSSILGQADLVPEFEDGKMVGVKIRRPKAGSVFQKLGIQDGDVIVELNGVAIDSPEQTAQIMAELATAEEMNIGLAGGRTVNLVVPRE